MQINIQLGRLAIFVLLAQLYLDALPAYSQSAFKGRQSQACRGPSYAEGQPHGLIVKRNSEGVKISEGAYRKGKPIGVHRWWNDDKTLVQEKLYENGLETLLKQWDSNGNYKRYTEWDHEGRPEHPTVYGVTIQEGRKTSEYGVPTEFTPEEISREETISSDTISVGNNYIIGIVGKEYFERKFVFERQHSLITFSRVDEKPQTETTLNYSWVPLSKVSPSAFIHVTVFTSESQSVTRGFVTKMELGKPLEPNIDKQTAISRVCKKFDLDPKPCFAYLWAPGWMMGKSVTNWTWIVKSLGDNYFVDTVTGRCWKQ